MLIKNKVLDDTDSSGLTEKALNGKPNEGNPYVRFDEGTVTSTAMPRRGNHKTRLQYLDLASGILILWIIAFHALNGCKVFGKADVRVVLPFLTFSMPWFFYKSGQFASAKQTLKNDMAKLLMPFLKWSAIGYGIYLLLLFADGNLSVETAVFDVFNTFYIYGYIPVNVPAWFVLSLFFVRVISRYIIKSSISPAICIPIGIVIGFGFHLMDNPYFPYYLPNIVMGIVFYLLGYAFSSFETKKWLFATCAITYILFIMFGCSIVGHHRNVLLSGHYLLWPVFAYSGIVVFNNLCRKLDELWSRFSITSIRPLSFIGQNSMILLVAHAFVYYPIQKLSTLSPWQTVGVIFIGYLLVLCPLLFLKKRGHKVL